MLFIAHRLEDRKIHKQNYGKPLNDIHYKMEAHEQGIGMIYRCIAHNGDCLVQLIEQGDSNGKPKKNIHGADNPLNGDPFEPNKSVFILYRIYQTREKTAYSTKRNNKNIN